MRSLSDCIINKLYTGSWGWIYWNNYSCLYLLYKYIGWFPRVLRDRVLIIQENLGNTICKGTGNQYKIETNNKANDLLHYPNLSALLSCGSPTSFQISSKEFLTVQCESQRCCITQALQCWHWGCLGYFCCYGKVDSQFNVQFIKKKTQKSTPYLTNRNLNFTLSLPFLSRMW